MSHSTETDVLIVGGGVIGVAIAYELAKASVQTLVIEKDNLGSQSTRAGAGMLGAQVEMMAAGPMYELGVTSRALFPTLREELLEICGCDMELQTPGIFRVAVNEVDRQELLTRQVWQRSAGQRAEWYEDDELRRILGDDVISATYGALYLPDDHQVRNMAFLLGLVASAKALGAQFREQTSMSGFLTENGAIVGVHTLNGPIRANRVVLATGAWTGLLGRELNLDIPIHPVKGQSLLLNSYAPPTPYTIFTHGCYILPKRNGQVYVGATEEESGFDSRPNLGALAQLSNQAVGLMPSLASLPFVEPIAGLRPGSRDGLPVLGGVPGAPGLYIASGHFRNGVLLSAITGKVMREVLTGQQTSVDLTPFSVARSVNT
ncbi:glycine oxidase ThiO [Tumebacillus permanentifrigoris]|uniref:glycine oxidase n=1 Tax=Tumebacillus permanentifrigoris TaxID=378543 RepID=A0A316D958_9BACL|nr:glycine oxidase ThiO [Tumebacillus permanentifrigoris]PWK11350.1 glycine oxidase [Tumebacillus permanentifrigoris]